MGGTAYSETLPMCSYNPQLFIGSRRIRQPAAMTGAEISELHRSCGNYTAIVDEIVRMEKKVFPKHESLATTFHQALAKNNSGLIFAHLDGEVAGYVMYCWPSSLSGAVTKLAGSNAAHRSFAARKTASVQSLPIYGGEQLQRCISIQISLVYQTL
ncbi:hypothetical protein Drorol1_Dr00024934 [Drosera rotundifolia]